MISPSVHDTRMAKALSHEVRVKALEILSRGPASPSSIAKELDLPVANVSYHMNTLLRLQCIEEVDVRAVRGALEHRYRAPQPWMADLNNWSQMPDTAKMTFAGQVGQKIFEEYTAALESGRLVDRDEMHLASSELQLDEGAWQRVHDILDATVAQIMDEQAAASERIQHGEPEGQVTSSLFATMHFETDADTE